GELLETFSDAEWETPSLCQGWRVHDVVAHCIQTHLVTPWSLVGDWIRAGFSLKARNARGVARRRSKSSSELLSEYRATAGRSSALPGQVTYALVEAVITEKTLPGPLAGALTQHRGASSRWRRSPAEPTQSLVVSGAAPGSRSALPISPGRLVQARE